MATEDDKRNVRRWRDEIWNKRNLSVIDELASPAYVGHMAGIPDPIRGPEALKRLFATYLAAFDTHVTTEFVIAEGDLVVARDTNWVKHTGAFQDHPPTSKELTLTSTDIYRIVDGRFVEQWFEADLTGMLHQLGLLPTSGQGTGTSTEQNEATVRRVYEALFEEKRLDRADELFTQDYLDHGALPGQAPGLAGAKQKWAMWLAAVPDLHVPIDDLVAEGEKVAVRFTIEGTHQGTLLGIPPTGKALRATGISIVRLAEGRIAENWEEGDRLGLLQQLGTIPAPAPTGQAVSSQASSRAA